MAKPTIDVQVTVADADDEVGFRSAIEGLGLELRFVVAGWRYFRPPADLPRSWQVHVRTAGSPRQRAALLFRDYLRANPAQAREYEALKLGLAEVHEADRIAYNDGKSEWIEAALRRAEGWAAASHWQP
jgi:dephospho-CoA kinase